MADTKMKGWQLQAPGPLEKTLALREDIPRPDRVFTRTR